MLKFFSDIFIDARTANIIAWGSLAVALVSLKYTKLAYERDKPRLRFEIWTVLDHDHPGYIEIKATNVGRLPISMLRLRGEDVHGRGQEQFFSSHLDAGLKLGEHEVKVFKVSHLPRGPDSFNADAMGVDDDVHLEFCRMWIVDALGDCTEIPSMTSLLPALATHYKAWCKRTNYWSPQNHQPQQAQDSNIHRFLR